MATQVRLTLAKAIAKSNPRHAEVGQKTITRLARNDQKAASALSLERAGKIVTVLECGIEDLLEVVEGSCSIASQQSSDLLGHQVHRSRSNKKADPSRTAR